MGNRIAREGAVPEEQLSTLDSEVFHIQQRQKDMGDTVREIDERVRDVEKKITGQGVMLRAVLTLGTLTFAAVITGIVAALSRGVHP